MRLPVTILALALALLGGCSSVDARALILPLNTTSFPAQPPPPVPTLPAVANDRPLIGILTQACHRCPGR